MSAQSRWVRGDNRWVGTEQVRGSSRRVAPESSEVS